MTSSTGRASARHPSQDGPARRLASVDVPVFHGRTGSIAEVSQAHLFDVIDQSHGMREPTVGQLTTLLYEAVASLGSANLNEDDDDLVALIVDASPDYRLRDHTVDGWFHFAHRRRRVIVPGLEHALFVSPAFEERGRVLPQIVRALARLGTTRFRIGDELGSHRSEWIVAYFRSSTEVISAAREVMKACPDTAWQGVPFTSELGYGRGLGWAVEPPTSLHAPVELDTSMNWRRYVCMALATGIGQARVAAYGHTLTDSVAAASALNAARSAGVEVDTWRASPALLESWANRTQQDATRAEQGATIEPVISLLSLVAVQGETPHA